MALTSNLNVPQRAANAFGYRVGPGVHVYAGALLMFNAAGLVQRIQDTGGVAFAGMSDREVDNSQSTTASSFPVFARRDVAVSIPLAGATFANVGAPIYATDDATITLSSNSGANPLVGNLVGFENGYPWIRLLR